MSHEDTDDLLVLVGLVFLLILLKTVCMDSWFGFTSVARVATLIFQLCPLESERLDGRLVDRIPQRRLLVSLLPSARIQPCPHLCEKPCMVCLCVPAACALGNIILTYDVKSGSKVDVLVQLLPYLQSCTVQSCSVQFQTGCYCSHIPFWIVCGRFPPF